LPAEFCLKVGGSGWPVTFSGKVQVTGNFLQVTGKFYVGAKFFRIAHPLDPENQTLTHVFVESDEISQRLWSAGDAGC
jgi:hypothetical protein